MNIKPIDVVHVIDTLRPGGAERMVVELANGLARRDISTTVCVTRSGEDLARELDPRIEVLVLHRKSTWDMPAILRFAHFCRKHNVHILHAHGRSSLKFASVIKLLCGGKPKLIFHDHVSGHLIETSDFFYLRYLKHFINYYIAVSPELLNWARLRLNFYNNESILIGNAIDLRRFQNKYCKTRENGFRAAIIANVRPQKGYLQLTKSLEKAKLANKVIQINVIGREFDDQYCNKFHTEIKNFNLENLFVFLGLQNDIPRILQTMDFGLLCSESESGPLVLLEYMAAGLPFLATRTGQIAETLAAEIPESFVEPGDIEGYARGLDALVSLSTEQRSALIERNDRLLRKYFDIEQKLDQLLDVYSLLGLDNTIKAHIHGAGNEAGNHL